MRGLRLIGWVLGVGGTSLALAADPVLIHPQQTSALAELQGKVEEVDEIGRTLRIRDTRGQSVWIRVAPETRILNNDNRNLTLASLENGDALRIWYNTIDHSANQIDHLPSPSEILLGR